MFFPVAGIEVNPLLPPLVALVVSYFCSMAGISGSFLLLPFQVSGLGYTAPSVSATNQFFNIIATPGGIYRYLREGRMLWPLAAVLLLGTFPGVFIGALIRVTCLTEVSRFKLFVALVLVYIGYRLTVSLFAGRSGKNPGSAGSTGDSSDSCNLGTQESSACANGLNEPDNSTAPKSAAQNCGPMRLKITNARLTPTSISYDFGGDSFSVPTRKIFLISLAIGTVGGVYGVGGGSMITPVLVSLCSLPIYTITAASLLATFGTSVFGVLFFLLLSGFFPERAIAPDFLLGLLFGLGGLAGMYLGARTQKFIPAHYIKWGMVLVIFATAAKYLIDFATDF
ncbi:sulfite exporter TauE/SafE family protein [Desulfovibrio sp. OttesenSCG-928-C06]|nr:sulfite exporter TauE/SafE family protein [Desulfovibrio sp. OttesenSCG-928-C06]